MPGPMIRPGYQPPPKASTWREAVLNLLGNPANEVMLQPWMAAEGGGKVIPFTARLLRGKKPQPPKVERGTLNEMSENEWERIRDALSVGPEPTRVHPPPTRPPGAPASLRDQAYQRLIDATDKLNQFMSPRTGRFPESGEPQFGLYERAQSAYDDALQYWERLK